MARSASNSVWTVSPRGVETLRCGRAFWIGVGVAAGLAWGVALVLWAQHGLDDVLVRQAAARDPGSLAVVLAEWASTYGKAAIAAIHVAGLVASFSRESWRRHRNLSLLTLLSLAVSGVAGDLLKDVVDRPRPAVAYPDLGFPAGPSTTDAFPSGHSTKAVALALPFVLLAPGWRGGRGAARLAVMGLALAVGASRVVLGAHYLSDVVGAFATALTGLPLAVWVSNALLRRMTAADLDRATRAWIGLYGVMIPVLVWLS